MVCNILVLFYTYKKLQGSQTFSSSGCPSLSFYTYKKLQGSQTIPKVTQEEVRFYTYKKLQGSQTQRSAPMSSIVVLHL